MKKRYVILLVCLVALLGIAVGCLTCFVWARPYLPGGAIYTANTLAANQAERGEKNTYAKLAEIQSYLDYYFVGDLDETQLIDSAAAGLVSGTGDRWSYYIPASQLSSYQEDVNNSYVGVGITIQQGDNESGFEVISVSRNSPAMEAGVLPGDVLNAVEGADAYTIGMEETKNRVRGPEGTRVTVTFLRDGVPYDATMTRRTVEMQSVNWQMLRDGAAWITISDFHTNVAQQTITAIEEARAEGATSLIFDVRNNGGGYKHEMVNLLNYLLPEGPLFRSYTYDGRTEIDESDKNCLEMPMAVLVNEYSYSAAEFFAVALQEYDWAEVIGTGTSGKGYYQNTFYLSDGSAVAISCGEYRTPKDNSLVGVGITPDVEIHLEDEDYVNQYYGLLDWQEDEQIQAALDAVLAEQ